MCLLAPSEASLAGQGQRAQAENRAGGAGAGLPSPGPLFFRLRARGQRPYRLFLGIEASIVVEFVPIMF